MPHTFPSDVAVCSDGVMIATRDYGGETLRPFLLLHGAGRSMVDWSPLAESLSGEYRLIAMDLRGHGQSESGPWTVASLLADADRVCRFYELRDAAVAGHSLGGILAHLISASNSSVSTVVNLDGFSVRFDEYVGLDEHAVKERMRARWRDHITAGEPITETLHGVMNVFWELSSGTHFFDAIAASRFPSLIVSTVSTSGLTGLPDHELEFLNAYLAGIDRGLQRLSECPNVVLKHVTAEHDTLLNTVDVLSPMIRQFLRGFR